MRPQSVSGKRRPLIKKSSILTDQASTSNADRRNYTLSFVNDNEMDVDLDASDGQTD